MARHTAATLPDARGTFLLEVALDRARVKQRLAIALVDERSRRGGGDARRFPQPEMARELGYSLRQYQRLENPDDPSLPRWGELEQIAERLGLDADRLFGDDGDEPPTPPVGAPAGDLDALFVEVRNVAEEVRQLRAAVRRLEGRLPRREGPRAAGAPD